MIIASVIGLLAVVAVVGYLVFNDQVTSTLRTSVVNYVNTKLAEALEESTKGKGEVTIGTFDYGFFTQTLEIRELRASYADSTEERGEVVAVYVPKVVAEGISPIDVLWGKGLDVGQIHIDDPTVRYHLWGDSLDVPPPQTAMPGVVPNEPDTSRFELPEVPNVDSLLNDLATGVLPGDISPLDISGITIQYGTFSYNDERPWVRTRSVLDSAFIRISNISLGAEAGVTAHVLSNVEVGAKSVERQFEGHHEVSIKDWKVSVNATDSLVTVAEFRTDPDEGMGVYLSGLSFSLVGQKITIDTFDLSPRISDKEFFKRMKYRGDRIKMSGAGLTFHDIEIDALTRGDSLHVDQVELASLNLDVISTKKAPENPKRKKPKMPYELIKSVPFSLGIDSIVVHDMGIQYSELHHHSTKPAALHWTDMSARVVGLTNDASTQENQPLEISARGTFMDQAEMWATITLPLNVNRHEMRVEGGMKSLDIRKLNTFLPIAENTVIESGYASRANFRFQVNGRRATGFLNPYYKDLKVKLVDEDTKESNLIKGIVSWVANTFVVHGNNMGDDHRQAQIMYTLPRDAAIFQTLWFPLRDGLLKVAK